MKYSDVTADELLSPDVVRAIHYRIERVSSLSRCPTWIFWSPATGRLQLLRRDEVEGTRMADRIDILVGVFTDRVTVSDLEKALRAHIQEASNDSVG